MKQSALMKDNLNSLVYPSRPDRLVDRKFLEQRTTVHNDYR